MADKGNEYDQQDAVQIFEYGSGQVALCCLRVSDPKNEGENEAYRADKISEANKWAQNTHERQYLYHACAPDFPRLVQLIPYEQVDLLHHKDEVAGDLDKILLVLCTGHQ